MGVIADLISKKNHMAQEINELVLWKEETKSILKKVDQEMLASNILTQRIVDLEAELNLVQTKYHNSMTALAEMEEAMLSVVKERKKNVQTKASPAPGYSDCSLEENGCFGLCF